MDFTKILQILQVNKICFFFAFTINWHINGRNVLPTIKPTWHPSSSTKALAGSSLSDYMLSGGGCTLVLLKKGLGWVGLGWVGLGWVGLGWVGWLVGVCCSRISEPSTGKKECNRSSTRGWSRAQGSRLRKVSFWGEAAKTSAFRMYQVWSKRAFWWSRFTSPQNRAEVLCLCPSWIHLAGCDFFLLWVQIGMSCGGKPKWHGRQKNAPTGPKAVLSTSLSESNKNHPSCPGSSATKNRKQQIKDSKKAVAEEQATMVRTAKICRPSSTSNNVRSQGNNEWTCKRNLRFQTLLGRRFFRRKAGGGGPRDISYFLSFHFGCFQK